MDWWEKYYANTSQKKAGEAILISKYILEQKILPEIEKVILWLQEGVDQHNIILNVMCLIIKLKNS